LTVKSSCEPVWLGDVVHPNLSRCANVFGRLVLDGSYSQIADQPFFVVFMAKQGVEASRLFKSLDWANPCDLTFFDPDNFAGSSVSRSGDFGVCVIS
jgi:hypothetical protein